MKTVKQLIRLGRWYHYALLVIFIGLQTAADAQITWRVSVKFIRDANGNRAPEPAPFNEDDEVRRFVDTANALLDRSGRGYRINLVNIGNLDGVSQ